MNVLHINMYIHTNVLLYKMKSNVNLLNNFKIKVSKNYV